MRSGELTHPNFVPLVDPLFRKRQRGWEGFKKWITINLQLAIF